MRVTTITIMRPDDTVFAQHLLVKIDQASTKMAVEHLQAGDHVVGTLWKFVTLGWNPNALVKLEDLLIDEHYTDNENAGGYPFRYRVISRPKDFDLHHQEFEADTPTGT